MSNANVGHFKVRFLVKSTDKVVEKSFSEYLACKKFVNRVRHSKKCQLLSYPLFKY